MIAYKIVLSKDDVIENQYCRYAIIVHLAG